MIGSKQMATDAQSKLCGAVIQGKIISAIGLKWHEPHFVCRSCGCVLSSTTSSFICKFSHPLCLNCNNKLKSFAAFENSKIECAKCNRPIDNQAKEMITYKNQVVHAYHFECFVCGSLLDASCKEVDGRLVCAADALGENKGNCQKCGKMVRGERSFVALGGVFHIECFTCTKCEKPFTSSAFWEYKSKPFCEEHYNQLMGSICGFCNEVSSGRVVTAIGKKWCEDHFFCHGCHCSLVASKFISWDLKPMCKKCFEALPRGVREILHKREEAEKKQHFRN
ncbi:hypothetical protein BDR26DRAFT_831729 [Obelidium mucronatum]|nr:hypothetical protein BDR26DRAFT_831729 [Obelidium mucronatum]